jgi:hypothetical protein
MMRVEIDIFSGRPNPGWNLSPDHVEELLARLYKQELPHGDRPPSRLGFRGFIVYRLSSQNEWQAWLRVGGGVVNAQTDAGPRTYQDTGGIEDWLLELAEQEGYSALLQEARGKD